MGEVRGDFRVEVGGRLLTFWFGYAAQDALRTALGKQWRVVVATAMVEHDVGTLATVAAAGLEARHPELTREALMAWSPPVLQLVGAIGGGLKVAWEGPGGEGTDPDSEGKRMGTPQISHRRTRLSRIWRWLGAWGWPRASSGGSAPSN